MLGLISINKRLICGLLILVYLQATDSETVCDECVKSSPGVRWCCSQELEPEPESVRSYLLQVTAVTADQLHNQTQLQANTFHAGAKKIIAEEKSKV